MSAPRPRGLVALDRGARRSLWTIQHGAHSLRRRRRVRRGRGPGWLPAGWQTGPPDFVGVGAQRSGTSWWFSLLCAHPGVCHPRTEPKEHAFFNRYYGEDFTRRAIDAYHWEFPRRPGSIAGEWTPAYMFEFWTPRLLARAAPDTRLLVLLRDPIARYGSSVGAQRPRGVGGRAIAAEAYARGFYHEQLRRLLEHFSREQLLVLQYERCRANPEAELLRTFAFLGLDEVTLQAALFTTRVNPTRGAKPPLPAGIEEELRRGYARDIERLLDSFPELDPALWPSCSTFSGSSRSQTRPSGPRP
jgi:hypothetical protein